ncbi:sugar transferase [Asaccharospora irregularis]|nr:sugar transferase [Asaccharospora irregularis]
MNISTLKDDLIELNDFGILSHNQRVQLIVKRLIELIISCICLLFLVPFFILISISIKIDSKGPIMFTQIRRGKNGVDFKTYKFRTMHVDSSVGNLKSPEKGDRRVTRVGWILRKTSLDETPQLINVLLGDMSIVGPRAVPSKEIDLRLEKLNNEYPENELIHQQYMKIRELVRPGITGMAQAYGRSSLNTLQATRYDAYYVQNFSLLLDIKVILKTIHTVLFQKGVN